MNSRAFILVGLLCALLLLVSSTIAEETPQDQTKDRIIKNKNNMNTKKRTQGRRKIEIKKIANKSNRQVTFSKRRGGLFKKAGELCILTGAEVAIIVQSSGKRVFAFGHPNVDGVIDRYITGSSSSSMTKTFPICAAEIHEQNLQYAKLSKELEVENKKKEILEGSKLMNNDGINCFWWDEPVDHLGLKELEQYMAALEELKKNVLKRADELALLKNLPLPLNNVDMMMNQNMNTVSCDDNLIFNQSNLDMMMNQNMNTVSCDDNLIFNQSNQYCTSIVSYASEEVSRPM